MKEIIIRDNEAGQRFDKYLKKYLSQAPGSFIYKMLRKKNIVLNGKKATGSEKLHRGDIVKFFFSDDTVEKFATADSSTLEWEKFPMVKLDIIYEDEHVLFLNKPSGMLSQKSGKDDVSVVEYIIGYLLQSGQLGASDLKTFHPSICNRLDRNTSGLITAGKSLAGLQAMGELFKQRTLKKYYLCIVKGKVTAPRYVRGYLKKDERTNKVKVTEQNTGGGWMPIETEYTPIAYNRDMTLLKVHLLTGRTHQIRAHLASENHPLLGDYKYGDKKFNEPYKKRYHIKDQVLHAYEFDMPNLCSPLEKISGRTFTAKVPGIFWELIKETAWEHGIQEALEVQH